MPPKSSLRLAAVLLCVFAGLAAFAGAGAGSGVTPRAAAPRLIAHDVSRFMPAARHKAKKGPQLLVRAKAPIRKLSNTALANAAVLNPTADISRTQLVYAHNGRYIVLSRTWMGGGLSLGGISNTDFWSGLTGPDAAGLCATNPQGEPSISYDWNADRWVISEAAYALDGSNNPTGAYVECVAVSTSPDATGTWSRYVYQVSTSVYADRPMLGVWSDGYYLSFNQLTSTGGWAGAGALALERSKMLTGAAAQARYFDLGNVTPGLGGMLPASISGYTTPTGGAPELFVQAHDDMTANIHDRIEIWGFHVDWTAPLTGSTFQPLVNIPLDTGGWGYRSTFSCPQPGGSGNWTACLLGGPLEPLSVAHSDGTDALSQLGGRLEWGRSSGGTETMTVTMTQDMAGGYAAPAWFKLSNVGGAGWGIATRGFFDPGDGYSRFLPSTAFDSSGNVGLAYVKTDSSFNPTTAYASDLTGLTETDIDASTVPFTGGTTFGGQTTLALDPLDLCTFWFAGPVVLNSGSVVSLDSFSLPGCTPSTTQPPLVTGDPTWTAPLVREGLSITGNVATFTGGTSTTYQWRRCDSRGFNCIDIPGANATTYTMSAADATGDRTLRFAQTSTNANGSSTAVSRDTTIVQSIPPVNDVRPAISGLAEDGQALSTTPGTWTSSSPLSYTYRWRRCLSGVCSNIAGANSATYTLTSADIGATVDVVVSATNTGGGTDANAPATTTVAAASAPPAGGSSGGGASSGGGSSGASSGGGTGGTLDLAVTGFVTPGNPSPGDNVTYVIGVDDLVNQLAQNLYLNVTLPAGVSYVSSTADRGSGCTVVSATQLRCFLDFLSGQAPHANVQIIAKVITSGAQVFSATATAQQSESSLANNTLTLTYNAGSAAVSGSTIPAGLNGDSTPTKKQDKRKPNVAALSSTGKRGGVAKLRFKIYDDHGVAKALTTIKRNGAKVGVSNTGFGPVAFGNVYYTGWRVPAGAPKGNYSFCVVGVDSAGNKSAQSCAPLAVK